MKNEKKNAAEKILEGYSGEEFEQDGKVESDKLTSSDRAEIATFIKWRLQRRERAAEKAREKNQVTRWKEVW